MTSLDDEMDEYDEYDEEEDSSSEEENKVMPLFQYRRLTGSLPRMVATPTTGTVSESSSPASWTESNSSPSPPPFANKCTASALGRVLLNADSTPADDVEASNSTSSMIAPNAPATDTGGSGSPLIRTWHNSFVELVAYGFDNGTVLVTDAATATSLGTFPPIRNDASSNSSSSSSSRPAVVSMCWDSTGTHLGVIDQGGMVAIYADLKYTIQLRPAAAATSATTANTNTTNNTSGILTTPRAGGGDSQHKIATPLTATTNTPSAAARLQQQQQQTPTPTPLRLNAFSNFMSALTGQGPPLPPPPLSADHTVRAARAGSTPITNPSSATTETTTATNTVTTAAAAAAPPPPPPPLLVPTLCVAQTASQIQVHRVSYPQSFGKPTCLALDPAYRRGRQNILVGFEDGRLVLTKPPAFLQRRHDTIVYQASPSSSSSSSSLGRGSSNGNSNSGGGIQAVAWRGNLVAWGDASGIRIWDVDQAIRIAHIDRPTGARPSLYPTVQQLVPSLCWETCNKLLVAWGDCLLQLHVKEQYAAAPFSSASSPPPRFPQSSSTSVATSTTAGLSPSPPTGPVAVAAGGGTPLSSVPANNTTSTSTPAPSPLPTFLETPPVPPPVPLGSTATTTTTTITTTTSSNGPPPPPPLPSSSSTRTSRRTVVECTMAWQLDCVACGVAPLDEQHVVVLGLVPPEDEEEEDEEENEVEDDQRHEDGPEGNDNNNNNNKNRCRVKKNTTNTSNNDVELQVVSRLSGEVVSSDLLPIVRKLPQHHSPSTIFSSPTIMSTFFREVASSFRLLSSFAVARMDDAAEAQALEGLIAEGNFFDTAMGGVSLFATTADGSSSSLSSRRLFRDAHLLWNMDKVSYFEHNRLQQQQQELNNKENLVMNNNNLVNATGNTTGSFDASKSSEIDEDTDSVDSDDYGIIFHSPMVSLSDKSDNPREYNSNIEKLVAPPVMVVVTSHDVVKVRVRDVDDAISFALAENKAGLALFRGLCHLRQLREYDIRDLVNAWFRAVLRLPVESAAASSSGESPTNLSLTKRNGVGSSFETNTHLSLRRMKLAAEAMPFLLGGNVEMWCMWITEMEKIPGALFIARYALPVRDPLLPKEMYAKVLANMLLQIEQMPQGSTDLLTVDRLSFEAEGHFLNTLVAWGTIQVIKEYIKLYQIQTARDPTFALAVHSMEESLARRREQSSACYLQFPSWQSAEAASERLAPEEALSESAVPDCLYNIDDVLATVLKRISNVSPARMPEASANLSQAALNSRVCLDAVAKLNMMKGNVDEALRYYLLIGIHHPTKKWEEIENEAIQVVNLGEEGMRNQKKGREASYGYVLSLIESYHLHQCLLDDHFLFADDEASPLFGLARLVGLDLLGEFLIAHCVAPQHAQDDSIPASRSQLLSDKTSGERRGTLPLDLVARQLEGSPKLLHWYLHLVFIQKPSVYVLFPNTANPPPIISLLHRKHLDLYIKFAGSDRDSSLVFAGLEAYRVADRTTPLLSFLKVVLQLGGIQPMEIGKLLQVERKGSAGVSRIFALELAYIMENFGDDSEEEARLILDLYLKGCSNLMLAVAYAQRAQYHSSVLWQILIDYCLSDREALSMSETTPRKSSKTTIDGSLFGSLLEAAALSGADLAHLVKQIPPGMAIEGLRPRLVSAVADYRLKVQMRQTTSEIANSEKIALLRELGHRSRRGTRYDQKQHPRQKQNLSTSPTRIGTATKATGPTQRQTDDQPEKSEKALVHLPRTAKRYDRCKLAYSIPIR